VAQSSQMVRWRPLHRKDLDRAASPEVRAQLSLGYNHACMCTSVEGMLLDDEESHQHPVCKGAADIPFASNNAKPDTDAAFLAMLHNCASAGEAA
jgi:hypothetical protein